MTTNYNIIACDGGGIRGLITAMLLDDLVNNPPPKSTSKILNNVNLFAGTSTGGIIAIGLACGLTTTEVVSLYKNNCSDIFKPYNPSGPSSALARLPSTGSFNPCSWLKEVCYVKYTNEGLSDVISNTLSQFSQVSPTSPLSKVPNGVLAVTFMMSNTSNSPWGPAALSNLPNSDYADVAVLDAAMCSSAAPLYFPPYAVPHSGTPTMWCADGGVVANNPSAFTLGNVLQSQILQQQSKTLSNVRMLSLGTGATIDFVPSPFLNGVENDWGMLAWLNPVSLFSEPQFPLLASMFDGQAQIAHLEASNILGNSQYQRANPTLTETINLDDCGAISDLETVANAFIQTSDWAAQKQWAYDNFV